MLFSVLMRKQQMKSNAKYFCMACISITTLKYVNSATYLFYFVTTVRFMR
jgi:hypothetical protein